MKSVFFSVCSALHSEHGKFLLASCLILLLFGGQVVSAAAGTDLGSVWTPATLHAPFGDRSGHSTVVFHDRLWVIAGWGADYSCAGNSCRNDVWSSKDGVAWSRVTEHAAFAARYAHRSVVFDDRIWVIGGRDTTTRAPLNDVWYSSDGIHWVRALEHAPFDPRWEFGLTVFNGEMWVIGGSNDGPVYNDVWHSSDGLTWERATADAGFIPRMDLTATSFKGKIWVTGGFDWEQHFNDLWCSENGVTWTKVADHAAFPARRYHKTEVADGKMWIIGGVGGGDPYDAVFLTDVWYTTNGTLWSQATADAGFPGRYGFTTAAFANRLWIIAGTSGGDIWYSARQGIRMNPLTLFRPLIISVRDQESIPRLYRNYMIGQLGDARRLFQQKHPDLALLEMRSFKMTVSALAGRVLTNDQAAEFTGSADRIMEAITGVYGGGTTQVTVPVKKPVMPGLAENISENPFTLRQSAGW